MARCTPSCPPVIPAGSLRNLVTIEAETRTPNSSGGYNTTWTSAGTAWAAIKDVSGNEQFKEQQLRGVTVNRFTFRFADTSFITVKHRLVFGGLNWNIRRVDDVDNWHVAMEVTAEAGVVQ